jgi:cell division protein FtsQ
MLNRPRLSRPRLSRPRRNVRKETPRRWQLPAINWRAIGVSVGSLTAVCAVALLVTWGLDQPIRTVSVSGSFQRVAPLDVERVVKQRVRGTGLLSVNLDAVRNAIHTLPWVDAVTVQRQWPRGLRVTVVEQIAAARWGETGLLNTRGELFSNDERHMPPELAQLSGPDGKQSVVAQRYLAAQSRLTQAGLRLTAMRLDARGAWEFDLSNGVTVRLGRRQIDERFDKFMAAALKIVTQRGEEISYVDMRYTNGFAIGWRSGTTHNGKEDGGRDA